MLGDALHGAGSGRELALDHRPGGPFDERVNETDVALRKRLPGLSDDAFDALLNL